METPGRVINIEKQIKRNGIRVGNLLLEKRKKQIPIQRILIKRNAQLQKEIKK